MKMKYFKRLKVYKSNNCLFNPKTLECFSYLWWCFSKLIGDTVIFNNTSYSLSTTKHQYNCIELVHDEAKKRGYKVIVVNFYGLSLDRNNDLFTIGRLIKGYEREIEKLKVTILNPRTREATNLVRKKTIKKHEAVILELEVLLKKARKITMKNLELYGSYEASNEGKNNDEQSIYN
jgi:hypothetical protein